MQQFAFLLFFTLLIYSCKEEIEPSNITPACIQEKIQEYLAEGRFCDDGRVVEYWFQDNYVYVFEKGTCLADGDADVFSLRCNLICTLGGITGNLQCNGDDFSKAAEELRTVFPN
ncbi:MAG: hypothetical protein AB8G22_20695 [Saprospiraceae bacterium]